MNPLNFEEKSKTTISIEVFDGRIHKMSRDIVIDITDINEGPTNLTISKDSFIENSKAQSLIATFIPEDPDNRAQETFLYKIEHSDDPKKEIPFIIENDQLILKERVNFSEVKIIPVKITVLDKGGLSFSRKISLNVIDFNYPPSDIEFEGTSTFSEETGLDQLRRFSKTYLGQFKATDFDGDPVTFKLLEQSNCPSNDCLLLESGGKVYLNRQLSFNDYKEITLVVAVSDGVNDIKTNQMFSITDIINSPSNLSYAGITTFRDDYTDKFLGTFSAIDLDGDSLSYKLSSAHAWLDLKIGGQLYTKKTISNISSKTTNIEVIVTDGHGGAPLKKTFTFNLDTGRSPANLTYTGDSIFSNTETGKFLGTFTAIDPDGDALTYKLSSTNPWVELSIDGKIHTKQTLTDIFPGTINIEVVVSDGRATAPLKKLFPFTLEFDNAVVIANWDYPESEIDYLVPNYCPKIFQGAKNVFAVSNTKNMLYRLDFSSNTPKLSSFKATQVNPSRTTIDDKGRVWVANRNSNSVTCFVPSARDGSMEYCFDPAHIPVGPGPRGLGVERISNAVTKIYVASHGGEPFIYTITVTNTPTGLTKTVTSKKINLLSSSSTSARSYGGYYSLEDKIYWSSDRANNSILAVTNLNTGNGVLSKQIKLNDTICHKQIYGIGRDATDNMPIAACLGTNILPNKAGIIKITKDDLLHKYKIPHKRPRGVSGDIFGHAWVALDMEAKVARVNLDTSCADETYKLNCNSSGLCTVPANPTVTRTPADNCTSYSSLDAGAYPVGVSATNAELDGKVYVVGHTNGIMYEFEGNSKAPFNYTKKFKFTEGQAYMYSDFTGFSSGFMASSSMTKSKCFNNHIKEIKGIVAQNDPRNTVTTRYFCSDTESSTGAYKALPENQLLADCVDKKCINMQVQFQGSAGEDHNACDTRFEKLTLTYKLKK